MDLNRGLLTIRKSLEETKKGLRIKETKGRKIRRLNLPRLTVDLLRGIQEKQAEARRMFGFDYRADLDLIFCHPGGYFIRPRTVPKAARRIAAKARLAGVSLHTMRHSPGSQLLSLGVPLPTLSERLGHANVHVTATVFSHALPQDEIAAAQIWNDAMSKTVLATSVLTAAQTLPKKAPVSIESGKKSA